MTMKLFSFLLKMSIKRYAKLVNSRLKHRPPSWERLNKILWPIDPSLKRNECNRPEESSYTKPCSRFKCINDKVKKIKIQKHTFGLASIDLSDAPSLTSLLLKSPSNRSVTSLSLNLLSGTYRSLCVLESWRRNTSSLRPRDEAYDDDELILYEPTSESTGLK